MHFQDANCQTRIPGDLDLCDTPAIVTFDKKLAAQYEGQWQAGWLPPQMPRNRVALNPIFGVILNSEHGI